MWSILTILKHSQFNVECCIGNIVLSFFVIISVGNNVSLISVFKSVVCRLEANVQFFDDNKLPEKDDSNIQDSKNFIVCLKNILKTEICL